MTTLYSATRTARADAWRTGRRIGLLLFALCVLACVSGIAQTAPENPELVTTASQLANARADGLDLMAPRHFERAQAAYDEAKVLILKNTQQELVHIKLKLAQDEIASARGTAASARQRYADALDARSSALSVGADTLSPNLWRKADERFKNAIREFEKSPTSSGAKISDLTGSYRAARLDALRTGILKPARDRLELLDKKGGEKEVPTMMLRAQQAMSRAEADVAKDNLDDARADAVKAELCANHALSMLDYIEKVRKTKQPWETALLPYDDVMDSVSRLLGGKVDYTRGVGVFCLPQLVALIHARQDSLLAQTTQQQQTIKTLEASLSDAQTRLSDLSSQIAELNGRLGTATTAAQGAAVTERIARAQSVFQPGEAYVLQGENNSVVIRLAGSLFPSGATKLDKARQKVIDRAADAVILFPGATLRVEGHTDSTGTAAKNQTASEERALSVAGYLAAKLKVSASAIPAQGFGSTRPVASNTTAEGRARNRRTDIILTIAK